MSIKRVQIRTFVRMVDLAGAVGEVHVQEWDEEHALHRHPVWATLPQSPTTFRLVQSPTTHTYQLDGSAVLRRGGAGLLAGVALMLVSTARSASSFGVGR